MRTTSFTEITRATEELLKQQHFSAVAHLIGQAKLSAGDKEQWSIIRDLLKQIPLEFRVNYAAILYAKALRLSWDFQAVVEWGIYVEASQTEDIALAVKLEQVAALNALQEYQQVANLAETIIPSLSGEALGQAWSRLGYALFHLNQPWEVAYQNALPLLTGEELGLTLLNYGYCLSMSGQIADARRTWLEALNYFKHNPYFLVWTRYNLATMALNHEEPEAERHLLEALKHVHHAKAQSLQATIWNSLGRFRMQLGEWSRAEFAFGQTINAKADKHDRQSAYRGLVRAKYLAGRFGEALETLEAALHDPDLEHPALYVAQAKVYLKLGQTAYAKTALEKAGKPQHELEEWPWRIASAELARAEDRLDDALHLLEGLPTHTLHSREEVRQWPKLFALLEATGREIPKALDYVAQTTVQVRAHGVLHVAVNGRPVQLSPTSLVGQLLVFLLEQEGEASLEQLGEALYPDVLEAKARRQKLWRLVDRLRETLGWSNSVLALRGAYQLDPEVTWQYDVAEARAKGEFGGEFLKGVYSEWALEVGRELQELPAPSRRLDLN